MHIRAFEDFFWRSWSRVFDWPRRQGSDRSFARRDVAKPMHLSAQQELDLDILCRKLFRKKSLIASGRLQILGLRAIRRRMGERWGGMREIIFLTAEEVIRKYMDHGDLFIRYHDDSYILLFAESGLSESNLKTTLMAEEIKRRLFEERGLRGVGTRTHVTNISRKDVGGAGTVTDTIYAAFEQGQTDKVPDMLRGRDYRNMPPPDFSGIPRLEVGAFATRRPGSLMDKRENPEPEDSKLPFSSVRYVPVWDHYQGRRVAMLAVADFPGAGRRPFHAHMSFYAGRKDSAIAAMDMVVLRSIIKWLKKYPLQTPSFGLICPVHYRTLVSVDGKDKYHALCQKIDDRMKETILFMVMDTPTHTPWLSLGRQLSVLKTYGRYVCAHVPFVGVDVDFESLRRAGCEVAGGVVDDRLSSDPQNDLAAFVERAERHLIHRTFILGADDIPIALAAAGANMRFLAGDAIHPCVSDPSEALDFQSNGFFRAWGGVAGNALTDLASVK